MNTFAKGVCLTAGFLLLGLIHTLPAQQAKEPPAAPVLVTQTPASGTFFLLGRIPSPPYPFDPYYGALPVFAYDGVFFVDDSQVSFSEQSFSFEGSGGGGMMLMAAPGPCNPCSTNGNGLVGTN